jgi:ParB-like chromosome segregation protein Spo0J
MVRRSRRECRQTFFHPERPRRPGGRRVHPRVRLPPADRRRPEGVIVCGHTRYKAAKLGLEKVPVHVATDLTPEQIRAYRIADNKTGELAGWDYDLLPIELTELKRLDYDLGLLGFDADELAKLLDPTLKDGLTDPDEVPEPPDAAITQPGDLWILGEHRLLCGDSSKPEDLDRLLGGAADPPGQHRPAVQREGRAAEQQRHRRRASRRSGTTHHQARPRAPPREGQAHAQEAAGQGPAAGERLRLRRGVRPTARRVVRQRRPRAGAGPRRSTSGAATPTAATTRRS